MKLESRCYTMKDLLTAIKERRSYYNISDKSTLEDDRLVEMIGELIKHVPSSFHSQSQKVVILLHDEHKKLWDITREALRQIVPAEKFASTDAKMNAFQAGYGTILFFDDTKITSYFEEHFPLYKENFGPWAQQANGMLQYAIWTTLEAEGMGANLQHYNPIIDEEVAKTWGIDPNWKLIAQMPFGVPTAQPDEKPYVPIEQRLKVFK